MKKNTNTIKQLLFLSAATLSMFFYVNATLTDSMSVQEIIDHSKKLLVKINAPGLSLKSQKILKKQKVFIDNYLSAKVLAKSCADLKAINPSVLNGVYKFFPDQNLANGVETLCEFENGIVKKQTDLSGYFEEEESCTKDNSCVTSKIFYQKFECSNENAQASKTYCNISGVYGTPLLVNNLNQKCTDSSYGFDDEQGFWVSSGCRGQFKMNRVPDVHVPLVLLTWNSQGAKRKYKIDVQRNVGKLSGQTLSCATVQGQDESKLEYVFSGQCDENQYTVVDENTSVRICTVAEGAFTTSVCTAFEKITVDAAMNFTFPSTASPVSTVGFGQPKPVKCSSGNEHLVVRRDRKGNIISYECAENKSGSNR